MNQHGPSVALHELGRRLIEFEMAAGPDEQPSSGLLLVCEKLRKPISTLAGSAGFRALLSRALTVARVEKKSLSALRVKADGVLEGADSIPAADLIEDGTTLVAQLIGLLVTFIGQALTMHLIKEQWPEEQWPDLPDSAFGRNQAK